MKSSGMKMYMSKTWVVFVCALVCCFLWGSAFPVLRLDTVCFPSVHRTARHRSCLPGTRFTLAGILVILFGSLIGRKPLVPARTSLHMVVKLALVQTVAQYIFFYIGLAHTSGVKSSIIGASNVFLSILVAVVVFHMEKLTAKKVIGCVAGFAGVVIINLSSGSLDMNLSFLGEGFIFLSAVSYAFSSALIKRYSENENPVTLSGYQFLCGGILLTGFGLAMGGRISLAGAGLPALGLLLYMAVLFQRPRIRCGEFF